MDSAATQTRKETKSNFSFKLHETACITQEEKVVVMEILSHFKEATIREKE